MLLYTRFSVAWQWRLASAFVLASLPGTAFAMAAWDPYLPRVGDHWHAAYSVRVCGEQVPPLPGAQGGVHTHGGGFFHIHPFTEATAGLNATLALAFATSGAELGNDYLALKDGQRHSNGDLCFDGEAGTLTLTVNGENIEEPASYVPRNRDIVRIAFR